MLNGINEIIKTVGGNRRKLITLIILLVFVGGFYIFKTIVFKNDCSDLIEQNQKLISKNVDVINVNTKLIDINNSLLTKITTLEDIISHKDTVFIKVPVRNTSSNIASNNIETNEIRSVNMMARIPDVSDTINIDSYINIDSNNIKQDTIIQSKKDTIVTDTIKKVGFFKRLFGKK